MGRAPCCEKMGLKKGPWTPEEDKIMISHIEKHGHGNWRALPKQAGLLRCGKSCRLRWTNYLRPDIKRGNFTKEEEEAIIQLHEEMGNRWSAIAAKLPGRTDNEIKNVWHTHLKKKLNKDQPAAAPTKKTLKRKNSAASSTKKTNSDPTSQTKPVESTTSSFSGTSSSSSEQATSSSEVSFDSNATNENLTEEANTMGYLDDLAEPLPEIDESFWSEALSSESSEMQSEYEANAFAGNEQLQYLQTQDSFSGQQMYGYSSSMDEDREFWFNVLIGSEGLTDLPEF